MATLDRLPNESLAQILSTLSIGDLVQVSRVSRRLCAVAEPLLYQAPCLASICRDVGVPELDLYFRSLIPPPSVTLDLFLRTIIGSPRDTLGAHVRSLSMEWDHSIMQDDCVYSGAGWFMSSHHPNGFHGTKCILLLHLLPSVRVLRINPPRDIPPLTISYFTYCVEPLHDALGDRPTLRLQSLREFSCFNRRRGFGGGVTVKTVLTLMTLPCLNSIDVHIVDDPTPYSYSYIDGGVPFSPVTRLRLSGDQLTAISLSLLLKAPTALTHFTFYALNYNFDIPDFMAPLSLVRLSLQHLHLDFNRELVISPGEKDDRIRGSFREWPVLRTLSYSAVEVVEEWLTQEPLSFADVLPCSLRGLQIRKDPYRPSRKLVDQVVELLRQKKEVVPALETVAVTSSSDDGAEIQACAELRLACENAGVILVDGDCLGW